MSLSLRNLCAVLLALSLFQGCASFEAAQLYRSGSQALDAGQPELAVQDLERAAELLPQASEIQNHLGLAYAESGRPEDALAAFRRAVELDCDNEAARHNLAVAERRP